MGRNSDYSNGMYQQLMEIMGRLETVEKESSQKIDSLNTRIDVLEKENHVLKEENLRLKEYNARLKSIINNDSPMLHFRHQQIRKAGSLPIPSTEERKRSANPAVRKDTRGLRLPKLK